MTAKPLLMLHGFAGSPRSWDAVLADAQLGRRPVTPHLPGHGDAPTIAGGFDAVVDHLAAALDPEPHGVVGYSLGARLALGLAVRHPRRVERLLLVGVNPGLDDEAERQARRAWDDAWATRIEAEGMVAFEQAWSALPLFATQAALPADRLEAQRAARLAHDPRRLAWAMRTLGLGRMPSRWSALPDLSPPTALVVGSLDDRYRDIALTMQARSRACHLVVVEGAGHNVPLETPGAMARVLETELSVT